jgi:hypothetical protein
MLNLLLGTRLGANSVLGIDLGAPGARHEIEATSNERFALGDTTTAGKAKTEGQSGFQMVPARSCREGHG